MSTKGTVETPGKDKIRSAIFSSNNFERREVSMFGNIIEIRQPSVAQLQTLLDTSSESKKNASILSLIEFSYVPGTDDKVFDIADYDGLLNLPMGAWFTEFNTAWSELSDLNMEEAEGN